MDKYPAKLYICPRCEGLSTNPYQCTNCQNQSTNFLYRDKIFRYEKDGKLEEIFKPIEEYEKENREEKR